MQHGNTPAIRALRKAGARLGHQHKNDVWRMLHTAAKFNRLGDVRRCLLAGMDASCTVNGVAPIHVACRGGHLDVIRTLIGREGRCDPNLVMRHAKPTAAATPCAIAAKHGRVDILRYLMSVGGDPTQRVRVSLQSRASE